MKRLIGFILLFLTGCTSFQKSSEAQIFPIIDSSSQVIEENESMEENQNIDVVFEPRLIPDADLAVPYEANRQVYITCENWDLDLYRGTYSGSEFSFYIYSIELVKEEDIKVTIPVQTPYNVSVKKCALEDSMGYHIYGAYRGVNWKMAQTMYEKMKLAYERREQLEKVRNARVENEADKIKRMEVRAEIREMNLIIDAYNKYVKSYKREWLDFKSEQFPAFYKYEVVVSFDKNQRKTEEFEQIRVYVGKDTYVQNIGRVCLHRERFHDVYAEATQETMVRIYDGENVLVIPIEIPVTPNVQDRIVLNAIQIDDPQMQLLGASIVLNRPSNGEGYFVEDVSYIPWNVKEPFAVKEATSITVEVYVEDHRCEQQYEYKNNVMITLDYLRREEEHTKTILYQIENVHSDYEICATVFHGVNVTDYFQYYDCNRESWEVTEEGIVVTTQRDEEYYFEYFNKNIFN